VHEKLDVVSQMTIVAVYDKRYVAWRHEQFAMDALGQTLEEKVAQSKFLLEMEASIKVFSLFCRYDL